MLFGCQYSFNIYFCCSKLTLEVARHEITKKLCEVPIYDLNDRFKLSKLTVKFLVIWSKKSWLLCFHVPPSMRKDFRAESLAEGSLSGTRGGGRGFRGTFWSLVRHCWSSERWSWLTDWTRSGCFMMTWSGYTIGLASWDLSGGETEWRGTPAKNEKHLVKGQVSDSDKQDCTRKLSTQPTFSSLATHW